MSFKPKINYSLIFPIFNEEENILPLLERIYLSLKPLNKRYEVIIVDNGSTDNSANILEDLILNEKCKIKKVKIITLERNFGYDNGVIAGLEHASGNYIVILDGDQQDPPEVIPEFLNKAQEGYGIVYGIKEKRSDTLIIKLFISIFYWFWSRFSNIQMPKNAGNFCVISREVKNTILSMPEINLYFRGIRAWSGIKSTGIPYNRDERHLGQSNFNFIKYTNYALDGITSFSTVPLRILTYGGAFGIIICFLLALFFLITKVSQLMGFNVYNVYIASGSTTIILLILFGISINLLGIGIIGEYVGRIMEETKKRPRSIIKSIKTKG